MTFGNKSYFLKKIHLSCVKGNIISMDIVYCEGLKKSTIKALYIVSS